MVIRDIFPFHGQHCESTATGTLLNQLGVKLSEPMLFGLGEGLGFIYWKMKTMDFPFFGGRVKTDQLTQNIARNLKLDLVVKETASARKAWEGVKTLIDSGQVVGLKLDSYYLEYFGERIHFAGHYVAIYGYDDEYAYLVDTMPNGTLVKTSLESLAAARSEKGPMSSRNLYYTLTASGQKVSLREAATNAIRNNAKTYLDAPISNIGCRGIEKAAIEVLKWFDNSKNLSAEFGQCAMLMEKAGTGGALFRNLYRDFLAECRDKHNIAIPSPAYDGIATAASLWSQVANLFIRVGETGERTYVEDASRLLREIAKEEQQAVNLLSAI